jgi:hypothetical protein
MIKHFAYICIFPVLFLLVSQLAICDGSWADKPQSANSRGGAPSGSTNSLGGGRR